MDDAFENQRNLRKEPGQYCQSCQRLIEQAFGSGSSLHGGPEHRLVKHYNSLTEVKEGKNDDCHLCSILLANDNIPEQANPHDIVARISYSTHGYAHFRARWHLRYNYKNNSQDSWRLGEVLRQGEVCSVTPFLKHIALNFFPQRKLTVAFLILTHVAIFSQTHQIVRCHSFATGFHHILSRALSQGWNKNTSNLHPRFGSREPPWLHR